MVELVFGPLKPDGRPDERVSFIYSMKYKSVLDVAATGIR